MKAFANAIKRSPKLAALTGVLATAIIVPASLMAWGPDRPTYTWDNPANHVTFNSMTNNPAYGDERNFVRIKEASAPNSTYTDNIQLQPGKEYEVYVYYHNNARTELNASGVGVAQNAKLRMEMPAIVKAGQTAAINGYISASNAQPQTVWDEARATTNQDVALRYVPNSATVTSFGAVNGQKLPDSLWTTGAALGFDSLNGVLPGCNEFAGYVKMRIVTDAPNFEVEKVVSKSGAGQYSESVTVNAGEKVDYRVMYKNTGTVQQNDVVIKDTLPEGVTFVPGTVHMSNANTNSQWKKIDGDAIVAGGINVGSYLPNGNVYVKFTAQVDGPCGSTTLINKASANTDNGAKTDTANVVVNKACNPGEINVCELATKKIVTIKESDFNPSKYSKNFADCKTATPPVTELPRTGIDTGVAIIAGLGALTAAAAYAVRSPRFRNLLRG